MVTKERDFQKKAVYSFEDRYFRRAKMPAMSPEECTALVIDVCRCYDVVVPEMHYFDGYLGNNSRYKAFPPSITLSNEWSRQRSVILHEVAHHIVRTLMGCTVSGHGKEFFSIEAYLLSEYMSIPLYEIFFKADKVGLKYDAYSFPKFKDGMKPNPALVKRFI